MKLTQRQTDVLSLIAQGLTDKEVGKKLYVTEDTVKTHKTVIFKKLNVHKRKDAVAVGRELGLIE